MCVLCIFIMSINTHTCMYMFKNIFVYILNIFIYNVNYMNTNKYIHVNIFKIYTACVCIYIYMITNTFMSTNTAQSRILCKQQLLFWMRFII